MTPRPADERTRVPSKNQIATAPPFSRHRMSERSSPLKSPVRMMVQLGGTRPKPSEPTTCPLLLSNHTAVDPPFSRQRMSHMASPLKSPVLATVQLDGTLPRLSEP